MAESPNSEFCELGIAIDWSELEMCTTFTTSPGLTMRSVMSKHFWEMRLASTATSTTMPAPPCRSEKKVRESSCNTPLGLQRMTGALQMPMHCVATEPIAADAKVLRFSDSACRRAPPAPITRCAPTAAWLSVSASDPPSSIWRISPGRIAIAGTPHWRRRSSPCLTKPRASTVDMPLATLTHLILSRVLMSRSHAAKRTARNP
mmetsp:Transcript_45824/g.120164  ORF Transcript_45824/g.120164 Transcript_45824/m.120164 type:complete len:204 (-) Transcript_45824:206-817(-)